MNRQIRKAALLAWLLLYPASAPADGGAEYDTAITWVETGPVLDADLSDPAWSEARVIDNFTVVEPNTGDQPSERTEVRIVSDGDSIYFGVRCYDSDPDGIVAQRMERDDFFFRDDNFAIALDTFHDHRNGYFIQVNPRGGRRDGIFEGSQFFESNWDGIWFAKAKIDEQGWVAEIQIPYKTLAMEKGGDVWGLNLSRIVRRHGEQIRWADPSVDRFFVNVAKAGNLSGMKRAYEGVGIGLDITPKGTLRRVDDNVDDRHYTEYLPSLDAFYRVLPSVTAAVTANTDFGEAQIDNRQVNLGRFDLFFPERRAFFLRDSGIFAFGDVRAENGLPFFSRRIGLSAEGDPVPLLVGGKVTGRIDRYNVGFLHVLQDENHELDKKNLTVARMTANLQEESKAGFLVTNGDPLSDDDNTLIGVDYNYRNSRLFGNRVVAATAWVQQTFTSEVDSDQGAYGATLDYPNDRVNWQLGWKQLDANFNPALGFVNRLDIREYQWAWRYRWRPGGNINTVDTRFSGRITTDTQNDLETAITAWRPITLFTNIDDGFQLRVQHLHDRPEGAFEIAERFIPAGTYNNIEGVAILQTSNNRPIRAQLNVTGGTFYSGKRLRVAPQISWRPSAHWLLEVRYNVNQIWADVQQELADGSLSAPQFESFNTQVLQGTVNISFTPNVSWNTTLQYDNVSDLFGVNSRVRWIIREGSDVFVVFNQDIDAADGRFDVLRTEPLVKFGWTFRF